MYRIKLTDHVAHDGPSWINDLESFISSSDVEKKHISDYPQSFRQIVLDEAANGLPTETAMQAATALFARVAAKSGYHEMAITMDDVVELIAACSIDHHMNARRRGRTRRPGMYCVGAFLVLFLQLQAERALQSKL